MLLRRITQHVQNQNWFAVFIDFLIVVVGVYIGLQVQNWGTEQNNRKLERHYLERLVEDMDTSIAYNIEWKKFVESNQANAWIVHQSLSSCAIPKNKQNEFANGLYQIGRYVPVTYELGTINEMQSAGNFSIIQNPKVRTSLNMLVSGEKDYNDLMNVIASRTGPLLVQFDRYLVVNTEHLKPSSGSVQMDEIALDFQSMCEDKELLPALSMIRSINQFHIDRYILALAALRESRTALRAELGIETE